MCVTDHEGTGGQPLGVIEGESKTPREDVDPGDTCEGGGCCAEDHVGDARERLCSAGNEQMNLRSPVVEHGASER